MEVGNTYKGIVLGAFRRLRGIGRDDELSCREEVPVAEDLLEVGIENVKALRQVYQWQSLYRDVDWPYTVGKTPCAKR